MAPDTALAVGASAGLSAALAAGTLVQFRLDRPRPQAVLAWLLVVTATLGPMIWVAMRLAPAGVAGQPLRFGLPEAIWISIAATAGAYLVVAAVSPAGRRLRGMVLAAIAAAGILATMAAAWAPQPAAMASGGMAGQAVSPAWLALHILLSVSTYGVLTVAALAGAAAVLQERSLKRKRPSILTRRLPAVTDSEHLQVRLLAIAEAVLALALITGAAIQYQTDGRLVALDHKTVFAIVAFAVIGGLLLVHAAFGLPGRRAARSVLTAYLLVTLAFPGVKLVTDIILQ